MSVEATTPVVAPAAPAVAAASGDQAPAAVVVVPPVASGTADAKVVAPPADAAAKIEVDAGVSKHFAELERRKTAFAQEQKAHAERLKSEEADRKAFDAWRNDRDAAKKDPVKAFGMLGMTADDVAKALYEAPQAPTPLDELHTKLNALQAKIDADEKAKADADNARAADAKAARDAENIKLAQTEIAKALAKPDFEITRSHGEDGVELVLDVMTRHWDRQGREGIPEERRVVLSLDEYAARVEAHLERIADTTTATEKYKRKLSAKVDAPKTEDVPKAADPKPKSADPKVVISNKTTADTPPGEQRPSDADKKAAAARVLNERWAAKRAAFAKKGA